MKVGTQEEKQKAWDGVKTPIDPDRPPTLFNLGYDACLNYSPDKMSGNFCDVLPISDEYAEDAGFLPDKMSAEHILYDDGSCSGSRNCEECGGINRLKENPTHPANDHFYADNPTAYHNKED